MFPYIANILLCNALDKRATPVKVNSSSIIVLLDAFFCSTQMCIVGVNTDFTVLQ